MKYAQTYIPGEYLRVAAWSDRQTLLRLAHSEPISQRDALRLISTLSDAQEVKFKRGSFVRGKARIRSRSIQLPYSSTPYIKWRKGGVTPHLRVGIVLHEIAHLLRGAGAHDKQFVQTLDALLDLHYGGKI